MEELEGQIRALQLDLRTKERNLSGYQTEHRRLLGELALLQEQTEFYEVHFQELRRAEVVSLQNYRETKTFLPSSRAQVTHAQIKLKNIEELIKKDLAIIEQVKACITSLEKTVQTYGRLLQFKK